MDQIDDWTTFCRNQALQSPIEYFGENEGFGIAGQINSVGGGPPGFTENVWRSFLAQETGESVWVVAPSLFVWALSVV